MLEGYCSFIIYSTRDLKQENRNGLGRFNQVLLQQLETDYNIVQTFLQVFFFFFFSRPLVYFCNKGSLSSLLMKDNKTDFSKNDKI